MKMMKHIQAWLLITLLALSASGVANAKLASGHQNLSGNLHQSQTVLSALLHQGLEPISTTATSGSPLATKEVPPFIFRGGGKKPGSLTPRPKDEGFLSARDALSNPTKRGRKAPLESGEPIQVIDTSKLPRGSVIVDGGVGGRAPGHVSIGPNVPAQTIKGAIVETIPKSATR